MKPSAFEFLEGGRQDAGSFLDALTDAQLPVLQPTTSQSMGSSPTVPDMSAQILSGMFGKDVAAEQVMDTQLDLDLKIGKDLSRRHELDQTLRSTRDLITKTNTFVGREYSDIDKEYESLAKMKERINNFKVNPHSQKSVDEYNRLIDSFNQGLTALQDRTNFFNEMIEGVQEDRRTYLADFEEYDDLVHKLSAPAEGTLRSVAKQLFNAPRSAAEVGLGIVTSIPAWFGGHVTKIGALAAGIDEDKAESLKSKWDEAVWQPETAAAQQTMEWIGKGLEPLHEVVQDISEMIGESWDSKLLEAVTQFIGEGVAFHYSVKGLKRGTARTSAAYEKAVREVVTETRGMPREVRVSADQLREFHGLGRPDIIPPEVSNMLKDLGLKGKDYRAAIKEGLDIKIPAEKFIVYRDKPWFQKFKKFFKVEPFERVTPAGYEGGVRPTWEPVRPGERPAPAERPAEPGEAPGTRLLEGPRSKATAEHWEKEAKKVKGVIFNGMQERVRGKEPIPLFTLDREGISPTTFTVSEGETLQSAIERKYAEARMAGEAVEETDHLIDERSGIEETALPHAKTTSRKEVADFDRSNALEDPSIIDIEPIEVTKPNSPEAEPSTLELTSAEKKALHTMLIRAGYSNPEIRRMSDREKQAAVNVAYDQADLADIAIVEELRKTTPQPDVEPKAVREHPLREVSSITSERHAMYEAMGDRVVRSPDTFLGKMVNDFNMYLDGVDVPVASVRKHVNELVSRAEEVKSMFDSRAEFEAWKREVEKAAKWMNETDRLIIKRSEKPGTNLYSGVPLSELKKIAKRIHPAPFPKVIQKTLAEVATGLGITEALDIFAGVGKIGLMKNYGFKGKVIANELEPKWAAYHNENKVDESHIGDARNLPYADESIESIITSPTYGNRIGLTSPSKLDTYTAMAGAQLQEGNTGAEVWGPRYEQLHRESYAEAVRVVKPGGFFILNMKDMPVTAKDVKNQWIPKRGSTVEVSDGQMRATDWHINALEDVGFTLVDRIRIDEPPRITRTQAISKSVGYEEIVIMAKPDEKKAGGDKGDTRLDFMIPIDQVPEQVSKVLKGIKATVGTLYRNKEVWQKTGFWLGKDRKWRYELKTNKMQWNIENLEGMARNDSHNLGDIITYPDLFDAVPELKDVIVMYKPNPSGYAGSTYLDTGLIEISSNDLYTMQSTLVHEVQHLINHFTGSMFRGSSIKAAENEVFSRFRKGIENIINKDQHLKEIFNEIVGEYIVGGDTWKKRAAHFVVKLARDNKLSGGRALDMIEIIRQESYDVYAMDPGEMEARLTSERMEMSPKERDRVPPWDTLDKILGEEGLAKMEGDWYSPSPGINLYMGIPVDILPILMRKLFGKAKQQTAEKKAKEGLPKSTVRSSGKPVEDPPQRPPLDETSSNTIQRQQAYTIGRQKGLVEGRFPTKDFTSHAKRVTGKEKVKDMTIDEAKDFIKFLRTLPDSDSLPLRVPKGKKIPTKEWGTPTLLKYFSPSNRYAQSLGVYDLIEDSIFAKTALENQRAAIFARLSQLGSLINRNTSVIEARLSKLRNRPTAAETRMWNALNEYRTAEDAGLKGTDAKIFSELRSLTDDMLNRVNEVRDQVGLDPITRLETYITYIFDSLTYKGIRTKYPVGDIPEWMDATTSKHIFNPTAIDRVGSEFELLKDPIRALMTMVSADLKQIYLEKPNMLFQEQMKELKDEMPTETYEWLMNYMNQVIKHKPTKLDVQVNKLLKEGHIEDAIDLMLKPFGRALGQNPVKEITGQMSRLVHDATIWGKVRLVIRNHTQKMLTLGLYPTKHFCRAMLPMDSKMKALFKEGKWESRDPEAVKLARAIYEWRLHSGQRFFEQLPEGTFGKLEHIGFIPYGHSHLSNINFAGKVAYHAAMGLVHNPKYKDLKWTESDALREVLHGMNTTQYWYNILGMPQLFRSGSLRIFAVLQSWWMNYFFNFWREMGHRAFAGKTSWGKPIPTSWRFGALRHLITAGIFCDAVRRAFGVDYSSIWGLGVVPATLSPPAQFAIGMITFIAGVAGDEEWKRKEGLRKMKNSYKAFIPGSGAWKDIQHIIEGNPKKALFYTEKPEKDPFGGFGEFGDFGLFED